MYHGISSYAGPTWSDQARNSWRTPGYWRNNVGSRGADGQSSTAAAPTKANAVTASATTLDAQVSRTGALQVTTDDGDHVSISFAALDQLHQESFRGQSQGTQLAYDSRTASHGVSVNVSVDGSLDSGEVADIAKLLKQLAKAIHDPGKTPAPSQFGDGGSLDSLSAYQFAYQEQSQVDVSSSSLTPASAAPTSRQLAKAASTAA